MSGVSMEWEGKVKVQVISCPSCGGSVKAVSIGWKCEKCHGFIDVQGNFHEHVEEPFLPTMTDETADFKNEFNYFDELKSSLEEAVKIKKLLDALKQAEKCIEILEHQRDAAVKYIEKHMVQDAVEGNEPCEVCAKASDTPCEVCEPKWYVREL